MIAARRDEKQTKTKEAIASEKEQRTMSGAKIRHATAILTRTAAAARASTPRVIGPVAPRRARAKPTVQPVALSTTTAPTPPMQCSEESQRVTVTARKARGPAPQRSASGGLTAATPMPTASRHGRQSRAAMAAMGEPPTRSKMTIASAMPSAHGSNRRRPPPPPAMAPPRPEPVRLKGSY
jgi:hypothetical protein